MKICTGDPCIMLILIGLGLGQLEDITLKGMRYIKSAKRVFLEHYTSVLACDIDALQTFVGRDDVELADRNLVESESERILAEAKDADVAFLVVGDALAATTHADLMLRAKAQDIPVKIVHNASIVNGVACCGLQLYRFGEIVSIPLWTDTWQPDSFVEKIDANLTRRLHTLCLLDIKVKEPNLDILVKTGRTVYNPPVFMTCAEAASQLCQVIAQRQQILNDDQKFLHTTNSFTLQYENICVALARVGHDDERICVATLYQMQFIDMGNPLHCLVIAGDLHEVEKEFLRYYVCKPDYVEAKFAFNAEDDAVRIPVGKHEQQLKFDVMELL